nr:H-2 class II histocompatibility antigen, A-U alpha chain-like [Misgurnus anguillicaudatus]
MEGFFITTLIVTCVVYTEAQSYYEYGLIETCGDGADQNEFLITFNADLVGHVDFKEKKEVLTLPDFAGPVQVPWLYLDAEKASTQCQNIVKVLNGLYANSSEQLDPPWSSIYSKSDAELNVENTLICHVTGFFPPPVTITWTKNNLNVTNSTTLSQYHPNQDGTMNVFSKLSFIPVEGDVYSCTVEHKALEQPQTRIWDVEIKESSNGPLVFCGVGLGFGLIGLAVGIFFIIKGSNCNSY